jgi:general secretion pathway protein A
MRLCHAALLETVGREKTRVGVSEVRAARDTNDRDPGLSWRAALVAAIPVVAVLFMVLGPGRERAARLLDQGLLEMGGAVSGFPDNVPGYDDLRQTLAEGGVSLRAWVDRSLREQPTASGGTVDQAAESEVPSPAASVAVEADGAAEPVAMVLAEPTPEVAVTPLSEPIPTAAAPAVATTPRAEPAVSEAMPAGSSPAVESVPAGPEAIPAPPAPAVLAEAPAPPPAVSETERPALSPFGQDVEEVVIQVEHHGPEPAVENAAAPVVIPALAPVQAATVLPDASDPPAAPASRILAATPPRTLGQMVMRPGWSLSKAAARLYGHASKRVMSDLARANPDIPDLNLVRPGDLVIFPVRVASPPPAGAQVVRLERLSGLDEAFSALSRVRERVQDTALFACFSPEAGLTFDVVLDHLYPDAVTAAQALAELPGDLASRAGTMALDDPLAIYYSSLVSPGGGDGPVAPVKAVAQNAAVPVAGAR